MGLRHFVAMIAKLPTFIFLGDEPNEGQRQR